MVKGTEELLCCHIPKRITFRQRRSFVSLHDVVSNFWSCSLTQTHAKIADDWTPTQAKIRLKKFSVLNSKEQATNERGTNQNGTK